MAMHIRNPRAHDLVKEIAALTGTTQEAAVYAAVEHYAAALRRSSGTQIDEILEEGAKLGRMFGLSPGDDPTAELYDETGLPR